MNVGEQAVRVWRPEGFEGLEAESCQAAGVLHVPTYYVSTYEFTLCVHTSQRLTYRGARYLVKAKDRMPGTLLVQHPHSTVGSELVGGSLATAWTLRISEAQFVGVSRECAFGEASLPYFRTPILDTQAAGERLAELTHRAFTAVSGTSSRLEREEALLTLIRESILLCGKAPVPSSRRRREHRAVTLVKDYLRENYGGDPTLATLACLTELNKTYLLEVFKREVGISPHGYLTCVRVGHAKNLLHQGLPIAQVAYASGFADQSHLNRVFKKYVLVTPGQYRRDSTYRSTFEQPQDDDAA